jgi:hypothetical protein
MRKILPVLLLCFFIVPAYAAAPDAEGAAALKKNVEDAVAWYSEIAQAAGQGLQATGTIEVTPDARHYKVRIPGVSVLSGSGFRLDIGDILINARAGGEGEWLLSVALPPSMTLFDAANAPIADVVIGEQRLAAAWAPALDFFPRYDLEYREVAVKPRKGTPYSATIARIAARQNLARGDGGLWSGPMLHALDGISLASQDVTAKLARASSESMIEKLSLEGRKDLKAKARALISRQQAQQGQYKQAELRAAILELIDTASGVPDGFSSSASLEGLAVEVAEQAGVTPLKVAFDRLAGAVGVRGMRQDRGTASVTGTLSGLAVTGLPPQIGGLVPTAGSLNARADSLPMKEFSRSASDIIDAASRDLDDPATREKASKDMQGTLATLPQKLAGAGTTLTVGDTYLRAPEMAATLEAKFTANAASPLVAVGGLTFTLEGLDEFVEKTQSMSSAPGATSYAQLMVPFQMMGKPGKTAAGRSQRAYRIELSQEGRLMLNGLDMRMAEELLKKTAPLKNPEAK